MAITLRLDWATHAAAKYACENWHYSNQLPFGKTVKIGAWEERKFIGVVIFGRGSNLHIGKKWGLSQTSCVELVRIALTAHKNHVSRILAIAMKFLFKQSPGIKMIISFADQNQGHHGGIYQAGNWLYLGYGSQDKRCRPYKKSGVISHWRTVAAELSKRKLPSTVQSAIKLGYVPQEVKPKHLYAYCADSSLRSEIADMSKPYPKRAVSIDADATDLYQSVEGGSIPTTALQTGTIKTNG